MGKSQLRSLEFVLLLIFALAAYAVTVSATLPSRMASVANSDTASANQLVSNRSVAVRDTMRQLNDALRVSAERH
jgi:hypothetical protein